VIALPELYGPCVRGIPLSDHGFIRVNPYGRVPDAGHVFAAGDATDFPVKHGGIASQQADIGHDRAGEQTHTAGAST
jgi:sulfide:quinone oxidoreductase